MRQNTAFRIKFCALRNNKSKIKPAFLKIYTGNFILFSKLEKYRFKKKYYFFVLCQFCEKNSNCNPRPKNENIATLENFNEMGENVCRSMNQGPKIFTHILGLFIENSHGFCDTITKKYL